MKNILQTKKIKLWKILFFAPILLVQSSCPPRTANTIEYKNLDMTFEYGPQGEKIIKRRYTIYAGTGVQNFQLYLTARNFTASTPIEFVFGDNTIHRYTSLIGNNMTSPVFQGNVGYIDISSTDISALPPTLGATGCLATNMSNDPHNFPRVETQMSNIVNAFPMQLNKPVDVINTNRSKDVYRFLTASGINGKNIDIVMDGAGEIWISPNDFVLQKNQAWRTIENASGGMVALTPKEIGLSNILYITVVFTPRSFLKLDNVSISVNEVKDIFNLTFSFDGKLSDWSVNDAAGLKNYMIPIIQQANHRLYIATEGRVRIQDVKVSVGDNIPLDLKNNANVAVHPREATGPFRPHSLPMQYISLDYGWWHLPELACGSVLAHELFHYKYFILDHYRDDPRNPPDHPVSVGYCPGCIMSDNYYDLSTCNDLCWSGSHNPYHDIQIGLINDAWRVFNRHFNNNNNVSLTVSPVHVVRFFSGITYPGNVTVTNYQSNAAAAAAAELQTLINEFNELVKQFQKGAPKLASDICTKASEIASKGGSVNLPANIHCK